MGVQLNLRHQNNLLNNYTVTTALSTVLKPHMEGAGGDATGKTSTRIHIQVPHPSAGMCVGEVESPQRVQQC